MQHHMFLNLAIGQALVLLMVGVGCATPQFTSTPDRVATGVAESKAIAATLTAEASKVTPTPTLVPAGITITGVIINLEIIKRYLSDDSRLVLGALPATPGGQLGISPDLPQAPISSTGTFTFRITSLNPGRYIILLTHYSSAYGLSGGAFPMLYTGNQPVIIEITQDTNLPVSFDLGNVEFPTSSAFVPPRATSTSIPTSVLPKYSEVLKTYPKDIVLCKTVATLEAVKADGTWILNGDTEFRDNKMLVKYYGTKITVGIRVEIDGKVYESGAKLTVDKDLNWIRVSSWD